MALQLSSRLHAGRWPSWGSVRARVTAVLASSPMARGALVAFLIRIASAAILYVSQVLLARWMGDTGYGIYVSAWVWALVLGGTAHLGGGLAMMRLVPELTERGDTARLRGLLIISRAVPLVVGSITAMAGLAVLWLAAPSADPTWIWATAFALLAVPAHSLTEVSDGIGRGKGWFVTALVPPYLLRPLLIIIAVGICHLAAGPLAAWMAAAAALAVTWLVAIGQSIAIERRLQHSLPAGPIEWQPQAWLATALPLLVVGGCDLIVQNADMLVVSHVLAPAMAGIYFASAKTMALIQFISYAVGSAAAHRFATLNTRGDKAGLAAAVRWAVNATFWPSLAGAVVILILGRPLLQLFGPRFVEGWPVMFVLVLGFLARAALGPADILLNATGAQRLSALALASGAALDIVLNIALVPAFGLVGAAAATSLAITAVAAANWVIARTVLGLDLGIWANLPERAQVVAKYRAMMSS